MKQKVVKLESQVANLKGQFNDMSKNMQSLIQILNATNEKTTSM